MRKNCEHKGYIKFEQKIVITFIKLFKKKKDKKISVNDLIKEAGIGRATFYKHFKSIDEAYVGLVKRIGNIFYEIFLDKKSQSSFSIDEIKKSFKRWFSIIEENQNLCQSLAYDRQLNKIVLEFYKKTLEKFNETGLDLEIPSYVLQAKMLSLVAGILNITAAKLRNDINCSWEELTNICVELILATTPNLAKIFEYSK